MNLDNGKSLEKALISEGVNQANYLESLQAWSYNYVFHRHGPLLKRIKYSPQAREKNSKIISPQETGIVALASMKIMSKPPANESELEALVDFQFKLQDYLGIANSEVVTKFYGDLVNAVKPEHNKLIPTLHFYHAQIHALKLAYERLKPKMNNADITTRVIFGLICIEFMKLKVRLYLIEPLARTEGGEMLDWIYMLDMVFQDFSFESPYNREAIRKKSVPSANIPLEAGLEGAMHQILAVRNYVAQLKANKQKGLSSTGEQKMRFDMSEAARVIDNIKRRMSGGG